MKAKGTPACKDERKKDSQGKKALDNARKGKETRKPRHEEAQGSRKRENWYGKWRAWPKK